MTKIDIISGFLGAGKTTLIRKLINEGYKGEKLVLIENEFGEIGVDGGFLKDSGVEIREMNSGCICCSLSGDFKTSMAEVIDSFAPDRILIEPSGVGKLSDVIAAVASLDSSRAVLDTCISVADAKKCRLYHRNFGEFFDNQVEFAGLVMLSRTKDMDVQKINEAVGILKEIKEDVTVVTTDWDSLSAADILDAGKRSKSMLDDMLSEHEHHGHGCHHEHSEHEHHGHGCHHEHSEHEHHGHGCHHEHSEHEHHGHGCHHEHSEHEHHGHGCHHEHSEHEHHGHGCHHEHSEHEHHGHGCCHDHSEHEHSHHHASDIFGSMAFEAAARLSEEELKSLLNKLTDTDGLGNILRAKGIVESNDGGWLHFDMVPGEYEIREGCASHTGILCIIGSELNQAAITELINKELKIG